MKRKPSWVLAIVLAVSLFIPMAVPAMAAKPAGNLATAQKVPWNLSSAVMPVPPYGSRDISGSDTASKLIVNQPNGNTEVTITGAMSGLNPNTVYTVNISKGYAGYPVFTGWNVAGTWVINVNYASIDYPETLILTQVGTGITGTSLNTIPPAGGSAFTITSGSVIGTTVEIFADHVPSSLVVRLSGTIDPDGLMSGTWADLAPGTRTGTWASTSGAAVKTYQYWPGLFNTQQTFTFTTDAYGAGSWHVNLKDADLPAGDPAGTIYQLSVWINEAGGTMLISDTFTVTKG
ncbi:MAG: hypothetical protein AAB577_01910 [Patescibacteria group bacterium]